MKTIEQKAKEYYNNLYHMPPNDRELAEFARLMLNEFISELEKSTRSVVWNYGLDSCIFTDKTLEGKKCLKDIKEEFLNGRSNIEPIGSNEDASTNTTGARVDGRTIRDEALRRDNQLNESKEREVQEGNKEETAEANN